MVTYAGIWNIKEVRYGTTGGMANTNVTYDPTNKNYILQAIYRHNPALLEQPQKPTETLHLRTKPMPSRPRSFIHTSSTAPTTNHHPRYRSTVGTHTPTSTHWYWPKERDMTNTLTNAKGTVETNTQHPERKRNTSPKTPRRSTKRPRYRSTVGTHYPTSTHWPCSKRNTKTNIRTDNAEQATFDGTPRKRAPHSVAETPRSPTNTADPRTKTSNNTRPTKARAQRYRSTAGSPGTASKPPHSRTNGTETDTTIDSKKEIRLNENTSEQVRSPPPRYTEVGPAPATLISAYSTKTLTTELTDRAERPTMIDESNPNNACQQRIYSIHQLALLSSDLFVGIALLFVQRWHLRLLKAMDALAIDQISYSPLSHQRPEPKHLPFTMSTNHQQSAESIPLPSVEHDETSRHWSQDVMDYTTKASRKFKPFNSNDAPRFNGVDITDFLEAFEDYCSDRAIPLNECVSRIPRQCTRSDLKETVLELPSYLGSDWTPFRKALLKEFEDTDPHQFRQTEDYLRSLTATEDMSADKLEGFCNRWAAAERVILTKGRRSMAELTLILFDCLVPSLLKRIVVGTDLDRSKAETLHTAVILANLRKEIAKKRAFERVTRDVPREQRRTALLNQDNAAPPLPTAYRTDSEGYARKQQVNFAETTNDPVINQPRSRSNSNQGPLPPALRQPSTTARQQAPARSNTGDIDELTKRFATFSMNLGVIDQSLRDLPGQLKTVMSASLVAQPAPVSQGYAPARPPNRYPTNPYNNSTNTQAPYGTAPPGAYNGPTNGGGQAYPQQQAGPPRPLVCNYCGDQGHLKRTCNILYSDTQDGHCHEQGNYVHEGRAGAGGPPLDPRGLAGRPLRDRLNIPTPAAPPVSVGVSSIRIAPTVREEKYIQKHTDYSSEESSDEEDSDSDESTRGMDEVTVHAARVTERATEKVGHEDAKEILRRRSAREAKLPTTRNKLSREGWKPVIALAEQAMELDTTKTGSVEKTKEGTNDKKPRTRVGQTWLQTQMKTQDPEKYLKQILKAAKLDVTVWDLLSSAPALQDLMFRKLMVPIDSATTQAPIRKQPEVRVSSIGFLEGVLHYLEDTPKIRVRIGNAIRATLGLIDTGAEVNVITKGLAHEARLPVRPEPSVTMVSHTGHTKQFTGICDDVEIDVGGVVVRGNFFVLAEAEHNLVLGNPFIKSARMTFRYDKKGRQFATILGKHNDEVEILASDKRTAKERMFEKTLVSNNVPPHPPRNFYDQQLNRYPAFDDYDNTPEHSDNSLTRDSSPEPWTNEYDSDNDSSQDEDSLHQATHNRHAVTVSVASSRVSCSTHDDANNGDDHLSDLSAFSEPDNDEDRHAALYEVISSESEADSDHFTDDEDNRVGISDRGYYDAPISNYQARLLSLSTQPRLQARVDTMYKTKDKKVRPVDLGVSDGSKPGGALNWKQIVQTRERFVGTPEPYDHLITRRFSSLAFPIAKGSRLTPERLAQIAIGDFLLPRERALLIALLLNREAAIAFDFTHCGVVDPLVAPPQEIRVIPHDAWQCRPFPIPKALNTTVAQMLQDRVQSGALEQCHGPYRNPWFLVKKGGGKYRLINAAMEMNRVTIRDANLPPATDEFAEEFAGNKIASLIDWFSGYDQVPLAEKSRDLTAFFTPLGLLRMTRLPQGATNSVAQFVRVVSKVLEDQIPLRAIPFLDDVGVKGPTSTYNNEEVEPGIRRYVLEHIQNLDATLCDLERAGCTIGAKSQFCMDGIKMVGYICDGEGRKPESMKVIKVTEWAACRDKKDIKAFLGLCVYYRIWIPNFSEVTNPLYALLRKDVDWNWGAEQDLAMDQIKIALTSAPALVKIDYSENAGEIILAVDASLTGWGAVLMQKDSEGKRHPSRYESGLWNPAEQQYDATKRECRGVLKALKKVRNYLYGIHFVLETDAKVLMSQLNLAAADLPGALVTRWLAWIRLFDFEVRHIAGTKHGAPDALSRRQRTPSDDIDEENEVDIDDFIEAKLGSIRVDSMRVRVNAGSVVEEEFSENDSELDVTTAPYLEGNWSDESQAIATFLSTLKRPKDMDKRTLRAFKAKALRFLVSRQTLFRRSTKNAPERRVVDDATERREIIKNLHDDLGHKGREATYRKVADRYWWNHCYKEVQDYCASCGPCQMRASARVEEPMYATWTTALWQKVGVDIVYMQPVQGKTYLVVARDDLSGWVEARALPSANAQLVAQFLWEDVVCRHGIFGRLVVDGGSENKGLVKEFTERYGIERVATSAYHPQANGMIERGHKPIVDALSKMTRGGKGNWVDNLHSVLFADRATTRASTGESPFYLNHGSQPVLPIELKYPTWRIFDFQEVRSTADLLCVRAAQFSRREEDLEEATAKLRRMRVENGVQFDEKRRLRSTPLEVGDLVLLHDAKREVSMSKVRKLDYRWRGPYRISDALNNKGSFRLAELDDTQLAGTFAGNRLKKFVERNQVLVPEESESDPDLDENNDRREGHTMESDQETNIVDLGGFEDHTVEERLRYHQIMARDGQRALFDGEEQCGPDGVRSTPPDWMENYQRRSPTSIAADVAQHLEMAHHQAQRLAIAANQEEEDWGYQYPEREASRQMGPATRRTATQEGARQHIPDGQSFAVVIGSAEARRAQRSAKYRLG